MLPGRQRRVQGIRRHRAADLDHRFAAAAGLAHRAAGPAKFPRGDGQCPLARTVRGCGLYPSTRAGSGRARHLHRRRRALRRGNRRLELAELPAHPYGGFLARSGADAARGRQRRAAPRHDPARPAGSPRAAAHHRPARAGRSAIFGDVEGRAAADQATGEIRHDHAGAAGGRGARRLLQGPSRAGLGVQRGNQPGAQRARRCRLPGHPAGGTANPHGAGARQAIRPTWKSPSW